MPEIYFEASLTLRSDAIQFRQALVGPRERTAANRVEVLLVTSKLVLTVLLTLSVYVCWNLYVITLGLVKASLIAFYLQVFHDRRFRIACWIVLAFIGLTTVIIQFLTIFACTPIESFWDRDIKGKCLDIGAIGFANSALAITQDLIILIMPMPSLFKLQMKTWRKLAVAFMFAVGAL